MDTAPKDRTFILVVTEGGVRALVAWQGRDDDAEWYGIDDSGITFRSKRYREEPVAWQPLPAPSRVSSPEASEPVAVATDDFVAVPTLFPDQDAIEYVMRDGPTVARRIDSQFTLLVDMENRLPVGYRIEGAAAFLRDVADGPLEAQETNETKAFASEHEIPPQLAEGLRHAEGYFEQEAASALAAGEPASAARWAGYATAVRLALSKWDSR